jgi:metal transporter CNNM
MAGLTLGLMSLGLVDLEVLIKSGRPQDRINAGKIFPVVKNQHLLLCTLLIGNSMAMEALPIFLDKIVPPWLAILLSVTLILVFGEVLYLLPIVLIYFCFPFLQFVIIVSLLLSICR